MQNLRVFSASNPLEAHGRRPRASRGFQAEKTFNLPQAEKNCNLPPPLPFQGGNRHVGDPLAVPCNIHPPALTPIYVGLVSPLCVYIHTRQYYSTSNSTSHTPQPCEYSWVHSVGQTPRGATSMIVTRMCVLKVWKRTHFEGHV